MHSQRKTMQFTASMAERVTHLLCGRPDTDSQEEDGCPPWVWVGAKSLEQPQTTPVWSIHGFKPCVASSSLTHVHRHNQAAHQPTTGTCWRKIELKAREATARAPMRPAKTGQCLTLGLDSHSCLQPGSHPQPSRNRPWM